MDKIIIKPSPNGDTRTAEGKVSFEEFQKSNDMHRTDVKNIMYFLAEKFKEAGDKHDWTKKDREKQFYDEFTYCRETGESFTKSDWYQNHIKDEKHHINSLMHNDITFVDVCEMIADCIAAGLARSGKVTPIEISKEALSLAYQNTCKEVYNNCELQD